MVPNNHAHSINDFEAITFEKTYYMNFTKSILKKEIFNYEFKKKEKVD
jgi:hypothetical protein